MSRRRWTHWWKPGLNWEGIFLRHYGHFWPIARRPWKHWSGSDALSRPRPAAAKAGLHGTASGKGEPSNLAQSDDRSGGFYPGLGWQRPNSGYRTR